MSCTNIVESFKIKYNKVGRSYRHHLISQPRKTLFPQMVPSESSLVIGRRNISLTKTFCNSPEGHWLAFRRAGLADVRVGPRIWDSQIPRPAEQLTESRETSTITFKISGKTFSPNSLRVIVSVRHR